MNADERGSEEIAKIAEIEKPCRSSFPNSDFPPLPPFLRVSKVLVFLISVYPRSSAVKVLVLDFRFWQFWQFWQSRWFFNIRH